MTELNDKINALPDLCLLAIFDHIPLFDLLSTINLVNSRWNSLLSSACARRHHPLILVQSKADFDESNGCPKDYPDLVNYLVNEQNGKSLRDFERLEFEYERYTIESDKFSTKLCERMLNLFPILTSLRFVQLDASLSQIDQLNLMLSGWKSTLVHLNLWFKPSYIPETLEDDTLYRFYFASLIESINSLEQLKHLELRMNIPIYAREKIQAELPILSQLETFKFGSTGFYEKNDQHPNGIPFPFESLRLYGQPNLKDISIDYHVYMEMYKQFTNHFAKNFLFIRLGDPIHSERNLTELSKFCNKFSSLKSLQLEISNISLAQLTSALSHLHQLEYVEFSIGISSTLVQSDDDDDYDDLPVIPSVKSLSLALTSKSHNGLAALHLHHVFPSLQVIRLAQFSVHCTECKYDFLGRVHVELDEILYCIHLARLPLKKCPKLKTILLSVISPATVDSREQCYTVEECLDEYAFDVY